MTAPGHVATRRPSRGKKIVFSLVTLGLLLGLSETALRVAGFRYSKAPLEMRSLFETPLIDDIIRWNNRDGVIRFVKDSKQLWVPAHSPLEGYSVRKKPGVVRVATLGCSCSAVCVGMEETYPSMMEAILNEEHPGKYEVLNGAVGSYSSFQGLRRLQHVVLEYEPDFLTVFFGWNDHWITEKPDHELRPLSELEVVLVNALEHLRTFQALNYLGTELLFTSTDAKGPEPATPQEAASRLTLRVPRREYEKNLNGIIDLARENGIRVLLLTAPADFSEWVPTSFFPAGRDVVARVHRRYNDTVRRIAAERGVDLLDLQRLVAQQPTGSVITRDSIHYHEAGCRFIANAIVAKLREMGI